MECVNEIFCIQQRGKLHSFEDFFCTQIKKGKTNVLRVTAGGTKLVKGIFGEGIYFLNGSRDSPVAALRDHVATLFL